MSLGLEDSFLTQKYILNNTLSYILEYETLLDGNEVQVLALKIRRAGQRDG